ncbi:MAG: DUF2459 domain-containing protein [Pseudomonadota bacterium]
MSLTSSRKIWSVLGLLLILCCFGCESGSQIKNNTRGPAAADKTIFVVTNGWHSGIVVSRAHIPNHLVPEIGDFADAQFLEFGWGDRDFYQADETTLGDTFVAALAPTSAVLHISAIRSPAASQSSDQEIISIPIDNHGFERLIRFIDGSFDRAGRARAVSIGPGLYLNSRFYAANGRFHLFNTCNTWTAKALSAGGLNISSAGVITGDDLIRQLAR